MVCPSCTKEELTPYRNGQALRGYCPGCGQEHEIQREEVRERWTEEEKRTRKKAGGRSP